MEYNIAIGIDAGTHTGFAVWCFEGETFKDIETTDFWGAIEKIETLRKDNHFIVVIEDVTTIKPVFGIEKIYYATKGVLIQKLSAIAAKAQNVGGVKRETKLLIDFCEKNGIPLYKKSPNSGSRTKMSSEDFKKLTGYEKRTSQHGRDAAMMIYKF